MLFSSPADAEENGRPFLDYVLTAIADAGYKKVCLVIGPGHLALQQYYTDVEKKKLEISFATQDEPKGLERERERERERKAVLTTVVNEMTKSACFFRSTPLLSPLPSC